MDLPQGEIMNKPIRTHYQAAKDNRRVGLTHVSKVIERLMRVYGLQDELIEQQELEASEMQSEAFREPVASMPSVTVPSGTQATFAWFE
jgi:hypothetical protein